MSWQELVLAVGSLFFTIALVPSIISKDKPALASSTITAMVLFSFAVVYLTLGLWFAAFSVTTTAIAWTILAVQKRKLNSLLAPELVTKTEPPGAKNNN